MNIWLHFIIPGYMVMLNECRCKIDITYARYYHIKISKIYIWAHWKFDFFNIYSWIFTARMVQYTSSYVYGSNTFPLLHLGQSLLNIISTTPLRNQKLYYKCNKSYKIWYGKYNVRVTWVQLLLRLAITTNSLFKKTARETSHNNDVASLQRHLYYTNDSNLV
jgi:hypothetical protein